MLAKQIDVFAEKNSSLIVTDNETSTCPSSDAVTRPIVVVGSGPVGMRFVEEVLKYNGDAHVLLFGNEPFAPYNRVQLSALLAGEVKREQINLPLPSEQQFPNFQYQIANIKSLNRSGRVVADNLGNEYAYDKLVLATGARAHIPDIPGKKQQGVYQFRNLADTESLFARITRCRHVVVLGGGLLGLEAAKALLRAGTEVSVIQQGTHLMNRQLDDVAAGLLRAEVERLGINVYTQSGVREILGNGRVEAVRTNSGVTIACDTVLICAGIQANTQLALNAKLSIGRGIVVNDFLQTSDPNIYAIGECCEHAGQTYGLVNPGFEQASVAASVIANGTARYQGSLSISRLKVVGQDVCSMGEVVELGKRPQLQEIVYQQPKASIYRKLILEKGKIIGAVGYGPWQEASRVQTVFQNHFFVWPWQRVLFRLKGQLWLNQNSAEVAQWPAKAIVCQCKNISKGELSQSVSNGASSVELLQENTCAGTVCGSCKPLLAELLGSNAKTPKERAWIPVLVSSLVAFVIAAALVTIPDAQVANSVQTQGWFEQVWNDKFWKQLTGFSLLGLTVVGLLMSLRKRFDVPWMGQFAYWRATHTVIGLLCAVLLIFHTGFHLGSNLNQILIINFLTILVLGSSAGAIVSLSHKLKPLQAKKLRKTWTWLHIVVSWPLPALLTAHVLSVYYF